MALNKSDLSTDLEGIFADPDSASASPPDPATAADMAAAWAADVVSYASSVTPASTTVASAEATLSSDLATAFQASDASPLMETAFATFATTVGTGMAPAFTATPPPGAVGFAAQFAGPKPATHEDAADDISDLIDTWMKTGTATPSGGGAPVNWS